jgi:type I restriction enzyme S subunit
LQSGDGINGDSIEESGEFPVFGGNGLRGYTGSYTHDGEYALIGRQGALCGNINYARGKFWASEHAVVVTPIDTSDTRWLGELLRAMNLNQYSTSAAQPGLSVDVIGNLRIPVPPALEQKLIAAFLDRETARIDELVAEQQRLIALLKEKRQAVISHAVTKGLNPAAPMKPSGVKWFAEMPRHWRLKRLRHLSNTGEAGIQMGPFGAMLTSLPPHPTGFSLFGQENTISGDFASCYRWISATQYTQLIKYSLRPGDIVLTRKGSIGHARIIPTNIQPGIMDSDTIRLRPNGVEIENPFLVRLLHEASYLKVQIEASSRGAILLGLNSSTIGDLQIALPPPGEQRAISAYLERVAADLDSLVKTAQSAIALLQERRTTLISAAVTGKIDVRGLVTKEAAA